MAGTTFAKIPLPDAQLIEKIISYANPAFVANMSDTRKRQCTPSLKSIREELRQGLLDGTTDATTLLSNGQTAGEFCFAQYKSRVLAAGKKAND